MTGYDLPVSLEIGGTGFSIRTDFRVVLKLFRYLNDPEYTDEEKTILLLYSLYEDADNIPEESIQEAVEQAQIFLNGGVDNQNQNERSAPLMDWEQDASMIVSGVNKVAGTEIRALPYLHWWTFLGYYMEIGEGAFSTIVAIRDKLNKGEKLEKYEREFLNTHREQVLLQKHEKLTKQQEAEDAEAIDRMLNPQKYK